jgi:hypothetical protein
MKWQFRLAIIVMMNMTFTGVAVNAQTVAPAPPPSTDTAKAPVSATDSVKVVPAPVKQFPAIKPKKPKLPIKEFSGGVKLNTDGYGIFVEKGWSKSEEEKTIDRFYNARVASIELVEHKHVKEIKQRNADPSAPNYEKAKPYIYGKVNNFYALKLGYGNRKMVAGKPEYGTVSIHWVYTGGLSIGMLKPYYLDAYVIQDNSNRKVKETIKYTDETKQPFLSQPDIVGPAGWSKGLGETKVAPGIFVKTGMHFDFAKSLKSKFAFEVGLSGELYTKKIEIMANQKAFPYLFNGYIAVQFGKRY